jgi:hypothetical protein
METHRRSVAFIRDKAACLRVLVVFYDFVDRRAQSLNMWQVDAIF